MVGEAGTTPSGAPLSSQALMELLNKRLEYFNLTDTVRGVMMVCFVGFWFIQGGGDRGAREGLLLVTTHLTYPQPPTTPHHQNHTPPHQVSLFLLRFPPETLFELEDIAMDAAMDSFDDTDAVVGPGRGDDDGREGRGNRGNGAGGLDEDGMLEEGVDLRLMGQLVPRFLGKVRVCWTYM